MKTRSLLWTSLIGLMTSMAFAQAPAVGAGGVVSAASLAPSGAPLYGTAPGGIISIFGTNLAVSTQSAATIPLPTTLNGTSVTVNGVAAPLFYVSAGQINAQVPVNVGSGNQPVIVKTAAGSSTAVTVPVTLNAPALFSVNSNGTGQAALQNAIVNGANVSYVQNGPSVAIAPGGLIVAYGTGGGAITGGSPAGGAACTSGQFSAPFSATIGGVAATVNYAGCSPTYVGLDQWNINVPSALPDGCFLPVQVTVGGVLSNMVTMAVAKGGNCSTATSGIPNFASVSGNYGSIFLDRFNVMALGFQIPTSQFTGQFLKNAAGTSASTSGFPPAGQCLVEVSKNTTTGSIGFTQYSNQTALDAGTALTLVSPSNQSTSVPKGSNGSYVVSANLSGQGLTVSPGTWTVTGPGGKDVGAFTGSLTVPAFFSPNLGINASTATVSQSQPLAMTWTCPDPNGQVLISISSVNANGVGGGLTCNTSCSAGGFTVPSALLKQLPLSTADQAGNGVSIITSLFPGTQSIKTFTATGITLGYLIYGDSTAAAGLSLIP